MKLSLVLSEWRNDTTIKYEFIVERIETHHRFDVQKFEAKV
jgi:hypothetical protein